MAGRLRAMTPRGAAWGAMAFLSLGVALYAAGVYALLPIGAAVHPEMRAGFAAHPAGVYCHVFGALFALALGPFQFLGGLRARHPRLHRWMGRAYLLFGVFVGGLAGLYLSQFAHGGPVAQLGFGALALAWLYTGARAFDAIRRGEIAAHRRWMTRNYALAFAAVMLRLYLPAAVIAGADFAIAYAVIAWASWVPNLVFAEWRLRVSAPRPPASPRAA
jgi:uncharacterized membrane protein